MGHIHTKTMTKATRVIVKKYCTPLSNNLYTKCVGGDRHDAQQETPQQDVRLCHTSDDSDSQTSCEGHLSQLGREAERGQIMFLGLQPWIRRSLRLILKPRKSNAAGFRHLLWHTGHSAYSWDEFQNTTWSIWICSVVFSTNLKPKQNPKTKDRKYFNLFQGRYICHNNSRFIKWLYEFYWVIHSSKRDA